MVEAAGVELSRRDSGNRLMAHDFHALCPYSLSRFTHHTEAATVRHGIPDLNATQAAIRAGYSRKTAQQQGSRLLTNVVVKRTIAAQQDRQLKSVDVRIQDVLQDLRAIAHTDLQTLTEQSGVPARWSDKLKALELLMKHLGLAAPETHQHVHQHVHFTPEQFERMSNDQLDRAEAAYRALATLEREVAADEARRASFGARSRDALA